MSILPEFSDLTCDGPSGCGHHIQIRTPKSRKEMLSYADTACPKCGGNMLTTASAESGWRILEGAVEAEKLLEGLGLTRKTDEPTQDGDMCARILVGSTPDGGVKTHRIIIEPAELDSKES